VTKPARTGQARAIVRLVVVLALALFATWAPSAQSTVADGVQAMIRGDYRTAASIFGPLAENTPKPDPMAQFFLGMLYESGRGVEVNTMRACSLYKSAATQPHAFIEQARALADAMLEQTPGIAAFCTAADWTPMSSTVLTIGQNHRIRIDPAGYTITYNGEQRYTKAQFGGPGWVVLPIRLIAVDVTRPQPGRRYFVNVLVWHPWGTASEPAWSLAWSLSEVSGLELVGVAGEFNVLTTTGPKPAADLEPETVVRIRANASGEAEWTILAGPNPRSAVIPVKVPR
jgi:hypothetical protein